MKLHWLAIGAAATSIFFFLPFLGREDAMKAEATLSKAQLEITVQNFLVTKNSPLAPETKFLLEQKHWKLLIAISAIESQYCTRQLGNNCWGIGGDSQYRHYNSVHAAIIDAEALIEHWQQRGRWLSVEDMNCHYVVPCNPNWVRVVNQVLGQLETYERRTGGVYQ